MTKTDDQTPMDTTEADSSAGVSCAAAAGYPSIDHVLDALESMADQYLQIKDKEGRKRYDHVFMSAGEECLDVLIAAGRIPSWMDYREGGEPPSTDNVSDQIPRTQDVADTTDRLERLSASVLFVPVAGVKYSVMCDGVGLGEDNGINVTISPSGNLVKGAEVNSGLHDAP